MLGFVRILSNLANILKLITAVAGRKTAHPAKILGAFNQLHHFDPP
jgi:hypothetical protein